MDEVRKTQPQRPALPRPSREEAEQAVRTLIRWAGDDPDREGLLDTPSRVARAYEEWFAGYDTDPGGAPAPHLRGVLAGYDDRDPAGHPVLFALRASHGADRRAGAYRLSPARARGRHLKLARRSTSMPAGCSIQVQPPTANIANTLDRVLNPDGVAVVVEATHAA